MREEAEQSETIPAPNQAPHPVSLKVLPPVTEKQGRCLEFILNYFLENRYYPTQREVAKAMGVRSNTAEMYLQPLIAKGYLMRDSKRKQRNIRLTREALERLKLLGVNVQERLAAA